MWVLALLLLILPALLPPASATDPAQPCPSEMNKVKDLLEVNCTDQGLSAVPQGLPQDTGILLLSINHLTSLSSDAFLPLQQLQDLDLSHNKLVALTTVPPLPSLKELLLSHNMLGALPSLQGLPQLTRLAVAHNRLTTLAPGAFQAVPRLQDLDLRGNQLQDLPQEVFTGLKELKDLDLSDNLLKKLPEELLQDLQKLETLWLSGNNLETLPTNFFPEGHIFMYVFLTNNPWHCDCSLWYLRHWIRQNEDSVYQPERGLEKTKVEVAPEKVVCQTPAEYQGKPIIHLKLNCGKVGDADEEDEEEYYEYGHEEEPMRKPSVTTLPEEPITMSHAVTRPPLTTTGPPLTTTGPPLTATGPPLSTPCGSTLPPSTPFAMPTTTRAPSTTTPAPASPTSTPQETPGATAILSPITLVPTSSLPNTMSTSPLSTSSRLQNTLATSTHPIFLVSTGTFSNSIAVPSTAVLETSSTVSSSPPPPTSAMPVVSTTVLSTHAPTPPASLDTTQPAPSSPPVLLCPCSSTGLVAPVLRSRAGEGHPQWALRYYCLQHLVFYLACLALLLLAMLALAGWLLWMWLVGPCPGHKPLQIQEYPLLEWRELTESPAMHLSSFQSATRRPTFCTIKEVELCPEVTYCTIKDLGIQHNPPTCSSFCTTKELWVHHSPPSASFSSFSSTLKVTNPESQETPSAYSLDRGVEVVGEVSVKDADTTL